MFKHSLNKQQEQFTGLLKFKHSLRKNSQKYALLPTCKHLLIIAPQSEMTVPVQPLSRKPQKIAVI